MAKRDILTSVTSKLNLVVLGTAAAGALALQSVTIAAAGAATFGALVAWDLVTGGKKKGPGGGEPEPEAKLGDAADYGDPQTRTAVQTIRNAEKEIARVLEESPGDMRASLMLVTAGVDELSAHAGKLARRADDLAKYLRTANPMQVKNDVASLTQRASSTKDPQARAQFEAATKARADHLRTLEELTVTKERIDASLLTVAATLEALPPKMISLQANDAQAMDSLGFDVKEELSRINGEIAAFEETLASMSTSS